MAIRCQSESECRDSRSESPQYPREGMNPSTSQGPQEKYTGCIVGPRLWDVMSDTFLVHPCPKTGLPSVCERCYEVTSPDQAHHCQTNVSRRHEDPFQGRRRPEYHPSQSNDFSKRGSDSALASSTSHPISRPLVPRQLRTLDRQESTQRTDLPDPSISATRTRYGNMQHHESLRPAMAPTYVPADPRHQICPEFLNGTCRVGSACLRRHPSLEIISRPSPLNHCEKSQSLPQSREASQFCFPFLYGRCRQDANCPRIHARPKDTRDRDSAADASAKDTQRRLPKAADDVHKPRAFALAIGAIGHSQQLPNFSVSRRTGSLATESRAHHERSPVSHTSVEHEGHRPVSVRVSGTDQRDQATPRLEEQNADTQRRIRSSFLTLPQASHSPVAENSQQDNSLPSPVKLPPSRSQSAAQSKLVSQKEETSLRAIPVKLPPSTRYQEKRLSQGSVSSRSGFSEIVAAGRISLSDASSMTSAESSLASSTSESDATSTVKRSWFPRELCRDWARSGHCSRGPNCKYIHGDLVGDIGSPVVISQTRTSSFSPSAKGYSGVTSSQHPAALSFGPNRPVRRNFSATPPNLSNGRETRASAVGQPRSGNAMMHSIPNRGVPAPAPREPQNMLLQALDTVKVVFGSGFEVKDVTTGFESSWVVLENMPRDIAHSRLRRALEPFGSVVDVRVNCDPGDGMSLPSARAKFSSPAEAIQAAVGLDGARLFKRTIAARLSANNTSGGVGVLQDSYVRVSWDASLAQGYLGYDTLRKAKEMISLLNGKKVDNYVISAFIHDAMPRLGEYTVRLDGLPPKTTVKDLKRWGKTNDMMLGQPKYDLKAAIKDVRSLLREFGDLLEFDVPGPPYNGGLIQARAYFMSPVDAEKACKDLAGRRFDFLANGILRCMHLPSVSYTLPKHVYDVLQTEINALPASLTSSTASVLVHVGESDTITPPVSIRLFEEDLTLLGEFKSAFEKLLRGEVLVDNDEALWDPYFARLSGISFLKELERCHEVLIDSIERVGQLRVFGSREKHDAIRRSVAERIALLRNREPRKITVEGRLIGWLMSADLCALQKRHGIESIMIDIKERAVIVHGHDQMLQEVRSAIERAEGCHLEARSSKDSGKECPVCFGQPSSPVSLSCGHTWCRNCLSRYLCAAMENKAFPLTCLGNDDKCSQAIPLSTARSVLSSLEFQKVVDAAFLAYAHARPSEFHYCPTPDCRQMYRSAPPNTVLQCPSCLTRICPSCHVKYHDGITCEEREEALDTDFTAWKSKHNVKHCPGCKIAIEKMEGCNHMTCTRCQTHICWVCLETFPKGNGIYDHMRLMHRGIGL